MADESVSVSISDTHLSEFRAVVGHLEQAGLRIEQQLDVVGVVTGQIDSAHVDDLLQVAGVANVERTRTVGIPPGEIDG